MRYVNVCENSQEFNTTYDSNDNRHNETKTSRKQKSYQTHCQPVNVAAQNGKNQHVGMAYVPGQSWSETYDDEKGFMRGTIFPELDLPFHSQMGGQNK